MRWGGAPPDGPRSVAGDREDVYDDQAEQRAVWDLAASFEPLLPVLDGDYRRQVDEARSRVRDPTE